MRKTFFSVCSRLLFLFILTSQATAFAQYEQHQIAVPDFCQQAKTTVEKANSFTVNFIFSSVLHSIKDSANADPLHEHIVAFGKDSGEKIIASPITTGAESNSIVPIVLNAFADLHTHPNGTPPSSGDLYGLLRQHQKDNSYDMRFVLLPNGNLYAFVISDAVAARTFYEKFPPQQTPGYSPLFPDSLFNEYREIIYRYGAKEELAMAYMLQKYNSGILFLKQDDKAIFRMLRTVDYESDGKLVFAPADCPD